MLLKICYKPNGFYYIKDIASIDFDSNTNTKYVVNKDSHAVYYLNEREENPIVGAIALIDNDFLAEENGSTIHETQEGDYYINNITFKTKEQVSGTDYCFVVFTGTAYLCDDSGKTIDVLR